MKSKQLPLFRNDSLFKSLIILLSISFIMFTGVNVSATSRTGLELNSKTPPKVAFIIDDFGGDVRGVEQFMKSGIPITVAIMPFLEKSKEQAELAHKLGLEVMVHLPMEPKKGKKSWLGPKAITSDLSVDEVRHRVQEAIDYVPHAVGVNNHMGSCIVEDEEKMRTVMEVIKEKNLYIIDSGTSPKSLIPSLAKEMNIPWAMRDIFLDNTRSTSNHVRKQMKKLSKVAINKGKAIGIGHVGIHGNQTIKGVSQTLEMFKEKKIEIVPASEIVTRMVPEDFTSP